MYHSRKIKNKDAVRKYINNYDKYIPKDLEGYFDGEVSILIVKKEYRGKKIGENLLEKVFELAKKDNINKLQILTTDSCSYQFYETQGCQQVYKTKVANYEQEKLGNKKEENAYIYVKKL